MGSEVAFRRIGGKIIPMRKGAKGVYSAKKTLGPRSKAFVAGAAAGSAIGSMQSISTSAIKLASTGLAIAGGVVSALPFGGGLKGFAKGTAIGLGIDTASTALNAAAAARTPGSKKDKVKAFAKQEAVNIAAGYGAFGATMLANPAVRKKLAEWGARIAGKVL
jgi:hypothetical protein